MKEGIVTRGVLVDMPWLRADAEVARTASANHAFVGRSAWLGDWVPDVVHAHDWHVGWAAEVLATVFDVPLVTTLHGTERGRHGGHLPFGDPTDINAPGLTLRQVSAGSAPVAGYV